MYEGEEIYSDTIILNVTHRSSSVGIITRFQYDIRLNQLLIGITTAILRRTARPRGIGICTRSAAALRRR